MHCFPISGHEILRIRRELPAVAAHLNGNSREFKFRPRKDSITVRISCLETSQSQLYHVARLFATMQLYFISLPSQQTPSRQTGLHVAISRCYSRCSVSSNTFFYTGTILQNININYKILQ